MRATGGKIDGMPTEDRARLYSGSHGSSVENKDLLKVPALPRLKRKRLETPEAGRGLEITAHAIESLFASEYMDVWPYSRESRLESIEILKNANREIYNSCPVIEPLSDRIMGLIVGLLDAVLRD